MAAASPGASQSDTHLGTAVLEFWIANLCAAGTPEARGKGAAADLKRRPTDSAFAPDNEVTFADGFPYLLIGKVCSGDGSSNDFTSPALPTKHVNELRV